MFVWQPLLKSIEKKVISTSYGIGSFLIHEHSVHRSAEHPIATAWRRRRAVSDRSYVLHPHTHLTMHHVSMGFPLHHGRLLHRRMQHGSSWRMTSVVIRRPLRPEQLRELAVIHHWCVLNSKSFRLFPASDKRIVFAYFTLVSLIGVSPVSDYVVRQLLYHITMARLNYVESNWYICSGRAAK